MYWTKMGDKAFRWGGDNRFKIHTEKGGEDIGSWRIVLSWNFKLDIVIETGLTYREAVRGLRYTKSDYRNPTTFFEKKFSKRKLESVGFYESQVPYAALTKIATQIRQTEVNALVGDRHAPKVHDDGMIQFAFYAGWTDMAVFTRIPGVVAANGYELIDYTVFGGRHSPTVYLQLKVKKIQEEE